MFYNEILTVLSLVANDKVISSLSILVTICTTILAFAFSPLTAVVVYISYILGYVVCWILIKYQSKASVVVKRLTSFYRGRLSFRKRLKNSCSICDDLSCKRHLQGKSVAPWKLLRVDKELNEALEKFYNRIIDNFITSWYSQFTKDQDFLNELRYCLRYATATVVNRILEVDTTKIITNKLLQCLIKHIDDYMYMKQFAKLKNARFNNIVIDYLGKRLHIATTNRKNELSYLQHLVSELLPNVLPDSYLKCRNFSILMREIIAGWVFLPLMDVIADPGVINSLVILATTYKPSKSHRTISQTDSEEFLENFVSSNPRKSSFATDFNNIKSKPDLLYAFMQFLKKQETVNLLQFCLDVDDFNNKLLTPDLSKKQLEELHSEAQKLYKEYLDRSSLNFIDCPNKIVDDLNNLLKEGVYSIAKLRTSEPLYLAYEHTLNVLENVWLPKFFHSNEFYGYICGSKMAATYSKTSKSRVRKYNELHHGGTVSKISSGFGKIKGALKASQTIDGALFAPETQNVDSDQVEDMILGECENLFRDLSTWRVSISSYQPSPSNKVLNFCVSVHRLDTISENSQKSWIVLRKDQDFYTLKAKLVEFHGENEICDSPLPSRKAGSSLEVRMSKYEAFLKRLLQKPTLRGSDLLYTFLTIEEDFTMFISTSTPVVQEFGNIYQSVAHKLRKEKGQHLDGFMSSFLNSVGGSKHGKFDWAEVGDEFDPINPNPSQPQKAPLPKTYRNHVFNDNFGIVYSNLKETSTTSFNPVGMTECVFYLMKNIFKIPHGLLRMYVALSNVAHQFIDLLCRIFIERKLKAGLCQSNLAFLIKQLEDVIFQHHISPTKEELEARRDRAFKELNNIVPRMVTKIVGDDVNTGMSTILEILQNAHYNKQLAYNLLDIILTELYPSLGKEE